MASETKYPQVEVQLTGIDSNAFNVIGAITKAMKRAGLAEEAKQFTTDAFACHSYDELLQLAMRTVTVA